MKFVKRSTSGYAHNLHFVLLENDENAYPEARLVTMADRHGELSDAEWKEIQAYDGADAGRHPGHFGGTVTRKPGRKHRTRVYARIKVYTD